MIFKILCFAVLALVFSYPAYGAEGERLDHECTLFVESGDSYIKLFGADWMRVFQANDNITFYNKQGKLAPSPEKLVIGQRLVVREGTYLTERAMERLSRYKEIRGAAIKSIHAAKALAGQDGENRSEVYEQGLSLLAGAEKATEGITFGFVNYLRAEKLAREAIRHFTVAMNLRKAKRGMEQLREHVEREHVEATEQIIFIYKKRMVTLVSVSLSLLGILWFIHRRNRRDRIKRVKAWLAQHEAQLERLERAVG